MCCSWQVRVSRKRRLLHVCVAHTEHAAVMCACQGVELTAVVLVLSCLWFCPAGAGQLQDLHSKLVLDHPRGEADQLHKCISSASTARGVFDGNVKVRSTGRQQGRVPGALRVTGVQQWRAVGLLCMFGVARGLDSSAARQCLTCADFVFLVLHLSSNCPRRSTAWLRRQTLAS
jgi:hypothetical protein